VHGPHMLIFYQPLPNLFLPQHAFFLPPWDPLRWPHRLASGQGRRASTGGVRRVELDLGEPNPKQQRLELLVASAPTRSGGTRSPGKLLVGWVWALTATSTAAGRYCLLGATGGGHGRSDREASSLVCFWSKLFLECSSIFILILLEHIVLFRIFFEIFPFFESFQ
jgi:hypothetical protein